MLSHVDKPKQLVITADRVKGKRRAVAVLGDADDGQGWLCYADGLYEIWTEPECKDSAISQNGR